MLDVDAVNGALDGTGWSVSIEADPDVVEVDEVTGDRINEPTSRIVARRGEDVHVFSPSHTDAELVAALGEVDGG